MYVSKNENNFYKDLSGMLFCMKRQIILKQLKYGTIEGKIPRFYVIASERRNLSTAMFI